MYCINKTETESYKPNSVDYPGTPGKAAAIYLMRLTRELSFRN